MERPVFRTAQLFRAVHVLIVSAGCVTRTAGFLPFDPSGYLVGYCATETTAGARS